MERVNKSIQNTVRILTVMLKATPVLFLSILIRTFLQAAVPFVNIIFSQLILDELIGGGDGQKLFLEAGLAITINGLLLLGIGIVSKQCAAMKEKCSLLFQKKFHFHQMKLPLQALESTHVREQQLGISQMKMRNGGPEMIITHLEAVIRNILNLTLAIFSFVRVFTFGQTVKSTSFWTSPWPLILLLFLTVMSVVLSFRLQAGQNVKISNLNQQANEANGSAFLYMELISDYHFGKDIRIYRLCPFLCKGFQKLWKSSIGYELTRKLGHAKAVIPCITSVCDSILTLLIYILAFGKALAAEITAGTVVLYIGSIQIFTQSIMGLVNAVSEMLCFGELLTPYLKMLEIPEESGLGKTLPGAPFNVSFEHVSFCYENGDKWALRDVSFTIEPGKKIAFVGENGSGKSTAIKLLCRFYKPQEGQITLNGVDIWEFELTAYRAFISVVFQDFSLPAFTISETIACGEAYEKKRMQQAIAKAGLSSFVNKQANLLDTYLFKAYDEGGVEASGGEAQKIAIARAVYKESPFMILDEPTAALDPRAEALVYEQFDQMVAGKTAVFISHRLSSCRFCHRIMVFHQGALVQSGTHEELVHQEGQYERLWEAQAQFYRG